MRSALQHLPPSTAGMKIGLFGGSFNPPHQGHRHVSLMALNRLNLDAIWWLVTPGNPLKRQDNLLPLTMRMRAARRIAAHPRIHVTDIEEAIGARYTADTLAWLIRRCPGVRFVWIMGSDNLVEFHRWQQWRTIANRIALAIVARPGTTLKAPLAYAALALAAWRIPEEHSRRLATACPPAWTFLHGPLHPASSTNIRQHAAFLEQAAKGKR